MSFQRCIAAWVVSVLVLAGCASNGSQITSGPPTPVGTTAPLVMPTAPPLMLDQQPVPVATTPPLAPVAQPVPTAQPAPTAPAEPTATTEFVQVPQVTSAPAPAATLVPVETAVPTAVAVAPTTARAEAPVQPTSSSGVDSIALGDFEVVNLVTGATQNIAELAPSGPTMLWFWAPH